MNHIEKEKPPGTDLAGTKNRENRPGWFLFRMVSFPGEFQCG
jgi:hypothetical protein